MKARAGAAELQTEGQRKIRHTRVCKGKASAFAFTLTAGGRSGSQHVDGFPQTGRGAVG